MSRFIPRIALWLLIAVAFWEGFVYLWSRPRFWVRLAEVAHQVGTSALVIYHRAKADKERRAARAGAHTGNTVTDIEAYLRQHRSL